MVTLPSASFSPEILHSIHSFKCSAASAVLLISQKFNTVFIKHYLFQKSYFSNYYVLFLKMTPDNMF